MKKIMLVLSLSIMASSAFSMQGLLKELTECDSLKEYLLLVLQKVEIVCSNSQDLNPFELLDDALKTPGLEATCNFLRDCFSSLFKGEDKEKMV